MMETEISIKTGRIMVVDDEASTRKLLVSLFARNGYATREAADGQEAVHLIGIEKFDLVLLDIKMPGMDGITALGEIKSISPETSVIMITGHGMFESAVKALSMGAFYYVTKPFESLTKLLEIAERAMCETRERKEVFSIPENLTWPLVALSEISQELNSSLDIKDLIDIFIKRIKTIFEYDYMAVLVSTIGKNGRHPGEATIHKRKYFDELDIERVKHFLLKEYAAFKGEAAGHQSFNFNFKDDIIDDGVPRSAEFTSSITLPLIHSKNILGIVSMGSHQPEKYSVETSRLLSTLVNQLASSLNNCLLYEGMKQIAMTDELTSLHNYRFFKQMMEYEFERAKRYEIPLSCIMMDIDWFKKINDRYGHHAGDRILSELASVLKGMLRKTDTLARYGGEEFALICPHTDKKEAAVLAERIRETVAGHIFLSERHPLRVTLSMGVAAFSENNGILDKNLLIKTADRMLYLAKSRGKNRVEVAEGIAESGSCGLRDSGAV